MESADELTRRVVKTLAAIAADVLDDSQLDESGHSLRRQQQALGKYGLPEPLLLYGDRQEALSLVAKELNERTDHAISNERFLESLRAILFSVVKRGAVDPESLEADLQAALTRLLGDILNTTVVIPVEGLWLGPWNAEKQAAVGPDLTIGQVTFKSGGYKELLQMSSEQSHHFIGENESKWVSALAHTDCSVGDSNAAREQGEFRVRLAVDVLRTALYRYKGPWGGALGLMSHPSSSSRYVLGRPAKTDEPLTIHHSASHRELPLQVVERHRRVLENSGLAHLTELFAPRLNKVLERLRRSINWFSDATLEEDIPESFLKQAVALEILLQGAEGAPIAESLAERVAFLLEKHAARRVELRDRVKRLYRYRNMIAHGSATQPPLRDLRDFEDIVAHSITAYAKRFRHLSRWRDVVADFDQQKFS